MCINDHMNWLHSTTNDENKEDERERQRKRIKTHQTKKNVKNHKEKVLCAAANLCPDINALCVCCVRCDEWSLLPHIGLFRFHMCHIIRSTEREPEHYIACAFMPVLCEYAGMVDFISKFMAFLFAE